MPVRQLRSEKQEKFRTLYYKRQGSEFQIKVYPTILVTNNIQLSIHEILATTYMFK